jgi:hypothetical protein
VTEFEPPKPPRVDGIAAEFVPVATVYQIADLTKLGYSARTIASHLHLEVRDVEYALRRIERMKRLRDWYYR